MTDTYAMSAGLYTWFWICCGALVCLVLLVGFILWVWMVNDMLKDMNKDERDAYWWIYIFGGPFTAFLYYLTRNKKKWKSESEK